MRGGREIDPFFYLPKTQPLKVGVICAIFFATYTPP